MAHLRSTAVVTALTLSSCGGDGSHSADGETTGASGIATSSPSSGATPAVTSSSTTEAEPETTAAPDTASSSESGSDGDTTEVGPTADTVKVYFLAGQSNAEGHGKIYERDYDPANPLGTTLEELVADGVYPDAYTMPREDVELVFIDSATGDARVELQPVQPGQGARPDRIGVEIGLAHDVGDALEQPVVVFKCAAGGTTLGGDWRPPTAVADRGGEVGPMYTLCFEALAEFLDSPSLSHPDREHELVAALWLQGWNDAVNEDLRDEYGENLADLGADLRIDLSQPTLPFVVVESPDIPERLLVARVQAVDALNTGVPGAAVFVPTTQPLVDAGWYAEGTQVFHWNQSARNYTEVGLMTAAAVLDAGFVGR